MNGEITVEVVRDDAGFAGLAPQWGDLLEESEASIFNSWEWLYTWHRRLGDRRSPYILAARDGESRLVGILPLTIQRRRTLGRSIARLGFLGETHVSSEYLDLVAAEDRRAEVARAFAGCLRRRQAEWDVLDLVDLDAGSPTIDLWRELFEPAAFELQVTEASTCPFITFKPGESFEEYLRKTSLHRTYHQRRRWLERHPEFRIETARDPRAMPRLLGQLFHLHRRRWAAEGGSQGISGPRVESFHRDATQLLAERGKVRLHVMWMGGEPLASVYGLVHHRKFLCYQCAYNLNWSKRSVGMVMFGESFRDAVESGVGEYDFLRGTESYKSLWTDRTRRTVSLRIHRRNGAASLLAREEKAWRGLRRLAKRVLPERLAGMVRHYLIRKAAATS